VTVGGGGGRYQQQLGRIDVCLGVTKYKLSCVDRE
jgi:hypothetical protein